MLNNKTKIIIVSVGITILLGVVNLTAFFAQNASAFSLQGAFNKLFGGLFHKPSPKQTQQQSQQQQQPEQNTNNSSIATTTLQASSSTSIPIVCHMVDGGLPDPKCTPGAINLSVTQNNIQNTICVPGYTKTVRPPVSYTTPLKIKLMKSYGFTDSRSNYELDHLVPLEIGGNPTNVKNLWPEPGYGQYNFHVKDRFENYLHNAVCNGSMSLSEAQKQIAADWISNWKRAGQP
ncbi:MAG TPA: hypothetical protein VE619_11635 [Nitrososphaeraceae archaeon]|nr:hypothetical protein [Nitrososphaeraceae archaeon]